MHKTISGFCPVQGNYYSVSVNYINSSDNEKAEYTKGLTYCKYKKCVGICNFSKCPIAEKAPDVI